MIRTILFDIHGVFFHESDEKLHSVLTEFGISLADWRIARDRGGWNDYKRGGMSEEDYWNRVCLQLPSGFRGHSNELCERTDLLVELDEDLVSFVRTLKSRYRVAVLSNAGAELERRLAYFGIDQLFETVINSHRVGMAKPDEAIFELACEKLRIGPQEILFVDDKDSNTNVAQKMGFRTHVYTDAKSFAECMEQLH